MPHGCYGFRLHGLEAARDLLLRAPAEWPGLTVEWRENAHGAPTVERVTEDRAEVHLQTGGWIALERRPARAAYHLPTARTAADVVHPYLAPAAALVARWLGREAFHAGAVLVDGGAWCVLGPKGAGKSTTLAWLAREGHQVLADDLAIVEDGVLFAGPRCLDLREEPAARLGGASPLGLVGARERWRLPLGVVPGQAPLRGWFVLGWADELAVEPVRGAERLAIIASQRTLGLDPARPSDLLSLSELPMLRLRRPLGWDSLPGAAERLLDAASA